MKNLSIVANMLIFLIPPALLFSPGIFAETKSSAVDEKKVSVPIQGSLVQRLEEAGLQPSAPQKVAPPEGFKISEIPQPIRNEHLSPAGQVRMEQSERKRAEGKQTETEHHLEKDTLFRDANLKF